MGRETKSLDHMAEKSPSAKPVPPNDLSTDTREESTITHEGSASTHEQSTVTQEESTLNEQSTSFELSVISQELSASDVHQRDDAVNLSQSTPKHSTSVNVEREYTNKTVAFAFQEDQPDGPHPNSSDDIPAISDDEPSTSRAFASVPDDEPSISSDVRNTSVNITDDLDDQPSTSGNVPSLSVTAPNNSEHVTVTSDVVLNVSEEVPSTSDSVRDSSSLLEDSGFVFVDSDGNVQKTSISVNNELKSKESNLENTKIDYERQSSTDSEPSVLDSKV